MKVARNYTRTYTNRRIEIVLTRLRIGHCRLTHGFILDGGSAPVCAHCDSFLTVEHILALYQIC